MPVIEIRGEGDIFNCDADVITIPVNCVGVMGKGLAKTFAQRFPIASAEYKLRCEKRLWSPGTVRVVGGLRELAEAGIDNVVFFPTKDDWRKPSQIEWIRDGLEDIVKWFDPAESGQKLDVLAVPALGCGWGGLDWKDVEPLIVSTLRKLTSARRVIVFAPRP